MHIRHEARIPGKYLPVDLTNPSIRYASGQPAFSMDRPAHPRVRQAMPFSHQAVIKKTQLECRWSTYLPEQAISRLAYCLIPLYEILFNL